MYVGNKKEICRNYSKVFELWTILNCYLNFLIFLSFLIRMYYIQNLKGKKKNFYKKISPKSKNNGRHKSQTQSSPMLIRRDYKCFCFLKLWNGIPFSASHFRQEIPGLGLGVLLESLLSSWQKEFKNRVERCHEIFTNPPWCLIHVDCMAVICHSLSCRR